MTLDELRKRKIDFSREVESEIGGLYFSSYGTECISGDRSITRTCRVDITIDV